MGLERAADRVALQGAEALFAVVVEDVGNGLAGHRLDVGVGVAERHPEPIGDQPADGGLACAGRTDQDEAGPAHRIAIASR